ncbi:hypothetical protein ABVK25_002715 [Lepraria finkii]|uniref:AAA+ ATPase domain-containing protein n=1 Tax=Lepraria finkii TaxID=1340010 RepID=A0ABR4BIX3_9LECA
MMPGSSAVSISSSSSSINEQIDQIDSFTPPSSDTVGNGTASPKKKPRIRASILEYKTVNQIWDRKNYGLKLVESLDKEFNREDNYEEYIFIERRKYDEANMHYKTFVDIKSEALRDVLREVLEGINTVSLRGDKPEIRVEVLFHYLTELESRRDKGDQETDQATKHLDLLVCYLQKHFASTIQTLPQLIEHNEITFDLLWALFPPNSLVYTTCIYSEQPKCLVFDFGDVQVIKQQTYWVLQGRYLDYDGKKFGEVSRALLIPEYRGAKIITSLETFPLACHPEVAEVESTLIERGRKFMSLQGVHHRSYNGLAHFKKDGQPIKFNLKGRFMVDPLCFKEHNANYERPRIDGVSVRDLLGIRRRDLEDISELLGNQDITGTNSSNASKSDGSSKLGEMTDEELLICSPTVLGFSLERRLWAEFAVAGIEDIQWSNLPFQSLVIPTKKKDMLQALVQPYKPDAEERPFDDFVEGKGKGLIILLHGPPGVGKTLTAEAISEYQRRPLYRVCAGDLGLDSDKLERRLTEILDLVARWKAILLLDEADVFLESRERQHLHHNTLVSVFLRQLEYFQGVMILTTNRVTAFDEAVQSRIHLGIKYEPLSRKAKAEVWTNFLEQANVAGGKGKATRITPSQLEDLSRRDFNGRQIKNTVRMAYALAIAKSAPLGYAHLIDAIEANEDFDDDFRGGGGKSDAMNSYQ